VSVPIAPDGHHATAAAVEVAWRAHDRAVRSLCVWRRAPEGAYVRLQPQPAAGAQTARLGDAALPRGMYVIGLRQHDRRARAKALLLH
jgi:hypothetical protein